MHAHNTPQELRHPNIVSFLGAVHKPGKLCLLTELCDTSLYDVLKDETRPLSVASMVGTLRQIALGVYYLHCCRPCVLHLDLKSANVLLDRHGVAKVTPISDCVFRRHATPPLTPHTAHAHR